MFFFYFQECVKPVLVEKKSKVILGRLVEHATVLGHNYWVLIKTLMCHTLGVILLVQN